MFIGLIVMNKKVVTVLLYSAQNAGQLSCFAYRKRNFFHICFIVHFYHGRIFMFVNEFGFLNIQANNMAEFARVSNKTKQISNKFICL